MIKKNEICRLFTVNIISYLEILIYNLKYMNMMMKKQE